MPIQKAKKGQHAKARRRRLRDGQDNRRSRKNVSTQATPDVDPIRGPRFSFLAGQLGTISKFEMLAHFGTNDNTQYEILNMIDTEAKQLQLISDLYQIVKAQPKYKNLKEPNWPATTNPITIIVWLLRKLGPLAEGRDWMIDTYRDGRKTRYRFVAWVGFHRQEVMDKEVFLPLDFLPMLKKRDESLHNIIIDTVALVSRSNNIPLWDEDGDFSYGLTKIIKESYMAELVNANRVDYVSGLAAQYLNLIRERMKIKNLDSLIRQQVVKYDDNSQRKSGAIRWIQYGLEIAATKQTLAPYNLVPNYIEAVTPVGPLRHYKFVWSTHWRDYVQRIADARLQDDSKFGTYLPVMFSSVLPGKKMIPIYDNYKGLAMSRGYYRSYHFPERLFHFMHNGWRHFNLWHDTYYNKNQEGETPTEAYERITDPEAAKKKKESQKLLINILEDES